MSSSTILSDNGVTSGSAGIKSTGGSDGTLLLQTTTAGGSATTAVTVDNAQNVGVGTSSPAYKLDVSGAGLVGNFVGSTYAQIQVKANGTNQSVYFTGLPNGTGKVIFQYGSTDVMQYDSSGNLLVGKTVYGDGIAGAQIAGAGTTYPGRICATVANSTSATEGIVVYSSAAGAYRFYVSMDGKVNATNTTIAAISDSRLKENIRVLDFGLSDILALQPRRYDWKEGKGANIKDAVGFIAQEFETVFPASVGTSKAGEDGIEYKNICHEELIPTMVKAIQELKAELDTAKEQIAALQGAAK